MRWALSPWAVSLAATAASTYALDAFAAAAGALLVAVGLLEGLDRSWVLAVLVASYAIWALGLRTNLRANGALLDATGTSTNVLSKAAYELSRRRAQGAQAPRAAAAVAYVLTEVAKELPYYAAAFGAAAATDAITSTEALVFLAGANIGAAAYEYGLGRLTGSFLHRRYASFEADWVPKRYLADYYGEVEPDELATISFFVDAVRQADRNQPILFFGVGPTLHHVFAAADVASEIHLGDYLPANLVEVQRWLDRAPGAHDWRPFVRYTLHCEGVVDPTDDEVADREDLTRKKITQLIEVDARKPGSTDRLYSTVISPYCADSATDSLKTWRTLMRNITGLVEPGGLFITAALHRCTSYTVGGRRFPSANVGSADLRAILQPNFDPDQGSLKTEATAQTATHGYASVLLCWSRKRPPNEETPGRRMGRRAMSRLP